MKDRMRASDVSQQYNERNKKEMLQVLVQARGVIVRGIPK
jgi:hypothetical protein